MRLAISQDLWAVQTYFSQELYEANRVTIEMNATGIKEHGSGDRV